MNSAPIVGDVLVATIGLQGSSGIPSVTSISQVNVVWTHEKSSQHNYAYTWWIDSEIWLGKVNSNAATNVTINLSSNCDMGVADVCEYSGVSTINPLDQTASNSGTGTSTSTGTTATISQPNELCVGCTVVYANDNPPAQSNPTNGFTLLDGSTYDNSISVGYLEKIVSSASTENSGTTIQTDAWAGCIATFIQPTTSITITSNPTSVGFVTVDGNAISTPYTFTWEIGYTHTITASSSVFRSHRNPICFLKLV
jgi:hypothetical protein